MIKKHFKHTFYLLILFTSCNTYNKSYIADGGNKVLENTLPNENLKETVYFLGNAGTVQAGSRNQDLLFTFLEKELINANLNSSLVFLGNNAPSKSFLKDGNGNYNATKTSLDKQLNLIKNFKGNSYFIPGNIDWNNGKEDGYKLVQKQEDYIQNYFPQGTDKVKFYPNNACGDIEVKKVAKDLYYIFIDSQWWLQNWEQDPKLNKGCAIKSRQEFLVELEHAFLEHKNDQVIVFMHHPLYSNGEYGGNFSLRTNLFPLTDLNSKLWIPLPIIGSINPLQRSLGGNKQDIGNKLYQELKSEILLMTKTMQNIVFTSAHEGNLQYFNENQHHFITSGAAGEITYAKKGAQAKFVRSTTGFSKLYIYENGEVWLDFIQVNQEHAKSNILYRKQIVNAKAGTAEVIKEYAKANELEDSIIYQANAKLEAKKFKQIIFGAQYRYAWAKPVKVPIVNFETEKGGVVPIKKGGGFASNSLRVENENGEQYALRSIKKDFSRLLGSEFGNLILLKSVLEDMNSASHPFAPLVLPKMSKAINIYYTQPKLVYLQKQEALGAYNELFNEELYLLEDRPAGNRENDDNLGNSKEIISYVDLIQLKTEDNQIKIDEEWTLRSRLFDIFIHDWDRHDDQWRWALIEENGEEIYRPIPRDRDQTFYKFQGALPWLASHLVIRKFKTFRGDVKDIKYQSFNARYFDRYFLHELEWKDWQKQVLYLQTYLTDEVIDESFDAMPPEISDKENQKIAKTLKKRRANLMKIAEKLYDYLSINVSIPGSNKNEIFEVNRLKNGNVIVKMYDMSKDGGKDELLFEREFEKGITKEIRLYGLGGKDLFEVNGKTSKSIKVRIIGGFGKDKVEDESRVAGLNKKTKIYDEIDGIEIQASKESRKIVNNELITNEYDREDHLYDHALFTPVLNYTLDDRLWIGVGVSKTINGFRKDPYKSLHNLKVSMSPTSKTAFQLLYNGDFNKLLFNKIDLNIGAELQNPFYVNYFGLGNANNKTTDDKQFNWVRMRSYNLHTYIKKSWLKQRFSVYAGPKFSSWSVKNVEGRVLDDTNLSLADEALESKSYLGGQAGLLIDSRDNKIIPTKGIVTDINGSSLKSLDEKEAIHFVNVEQKFYLSFGTKFATTFASRTGWNFSEGDLNFYNYASLGNAQNLRGFRNDRFRGNHSFYQNIDIRMKLLSWNNKIIPMKIGLLGGYDTGRVWLKSEGKKGAFHHAYTAGVWFNILDVVVLNPSMSFSKEEKLFNFQLGFNF